MAPLSSLLTLPRFAPDVGLHRVRWLMEQQNLQTGSGPDCIKIVGSKGKGSMAALLHAILQQLEPCGLYTSPHLVDVEERFRIGRDLVTPEALAAAVDWVLSTFAQRPASMQTEILGFFEAATAAVWRLFSQASLKLAVVEAGIGGRLDATRVLPGTLAGLTSVELEHVALLGPTLEHIAYDKIGIVPAGGTLLVGEIDRALHHRVDAFAHIQGIELDWAASRVAVTSSACHRDGSRLTLDVRGTGSIDGVWLALAGRHQIGNARLAVALACAWALPRYAWADVTRAVRDGLSQVSWPCRFERVQTGPDVFVDVCHTPASARACADNARELLADERILLVTGVSFDKDVEEIVEALAERAARVICTRAHYRGADVSRVASEIRRLRPSLAIDTAETIDEAMEVALTWARQDGMTVLVAGGLFLAAEARAVLQGRDPRALRFA